MKKLFLILCIIALCFTLSSAGVTQDKIKVIARQTVAGGGGYSCSGTLAGGDMESFEKGDGDFCVSDLTEVDDSSFIDTYDATESFCGSNSMKISISSSGGNDDYITFDYGSTTDDKFIRFVMLNVPDLSDLLYPLSIRSGASAPTTGANLNILIGEDEKVYLRSNAVDSTYYFTLVIGDDYLFSIEFDKTDNHGLRIWRWGTPSADSWNVIQDNNSQDILYHAAYNDDLRYVTFSGYSAGSAERTVWIDDLEFGSSWFGTLTCP